MANFRLIIRRQLRRNRLPHSSRHVRPYWQNLVINLALAIFSTCVPLLLLEAGLRLWGTNRSEAYRYAGPNESLFWRYDSLLGWALRSHLNGQFLRSEFAVAVQTNSLGLRDDEITRPKPAKEIRILLLGDSVTAGFEVPREETVESRLEKRLNELGDEWHYQIINAGFRGYGTDQELVYLQAHGMELAPEVVVLAFVPANDHEDNVTVHHADRLYGKPYFEYAADSSLSLRGVPVPIYPLEKQIFSNVMRAPEEKATANHQEKFGSLKKFAREHFYLYGFIAERLKNLPSSWVATLKKLGILQHSTPAAYLDFFRRSVLEAWQRRWKITLDLLKQMKNLCAERKIPLVIWMFPLKEQVYDRDRQILLEGYGVNDADYDFTQPEQILTKFCAKQDIFFLSPLRRFREEAAKGQRLHFISDNHFNAAGHELLADELFAFLMQYQLSAPSAAQQ